MNDHRWSLEHLPWYVNGTLVGEEQARVHRHLKACTVCQREYAQLSRICDSLNERALLSDSAPHALAQLQDELRMETGLIARIHTRLVSVFARTPRVVRYAVAVQALLLIAAGGWMLTQLDSARPVTGYQTLSQGALAKGDVRLVFSEDSTVDQRSTLLRQFGLTLIGPPTDSGVHTLRWNEPDSHLPLSELRTRHIVLFAEALKSDAQSAP